MKKIVVSLLFIGVFYIPKGVKPIHERMSYSKAFYSADQKLLRLTLSGDEKYRLPIVLEDVPTQLIQALLEKEDKYFFYHLGFNPVALGKAFFENFVFHSGKMGGSTLSMQLARLHYGLKTRSIWGKVKQIAASVWLEFLYSKKDILLSYLSLAPMGRNIEGLQAASLVYFKNKLDILSPAELISLIVFPQNPNRLNGISNLQKLPLPIQEKVNYYTKKFDFIFKTYSPQEIWVSGINDLPFRAPHLINQLVLQRRVKKKSEIKTTVNLQIQNLLEDTVKDYIERKREKGLKNAAAMIVDLKNMHVVSLVGSADFFDNSILGQNNGTLAKRSPGSTLKPLLFALAMEKGLVHPQSIVFDAPMSFRIPENFDNKFWGPMTVEKALITSRNVPAVYLYSKLDDHLFYETLLKYKISKMRPFGSYGSSIVLGGMEVSMQELIKIYASLANSGKIQNLKFMSDDKDKYHLNVLSPQSTALIMSILKKNKKPMLKGTERILIEDWPAYWKTGTSIGFRDAWSVGVKGHYAVAVWVGNFNGEPHPNLIGQEAAGPLFFQITDFLEESISPYHIDLYDYHEDIQKISVCSHSGKIPNEHCTHKKDSLFWPGVSPIKKCQIHQSFAITQNGKRACEKTVGAITQKVYEVWPSHILRLFKRLGIPRSSPPQFAPECSLLVKNDLGSSPKILSPKSGISYSLQLGANYDQISFLSSVDSSVEEVFWYIDDTFLGKTKPEEPLYWKAKPGIYTVKLVDDRGRYALRKVRVNFTQ